MKSMKTYLLCVLLAASLLAGAFRVKAAAQAMTWQQRVDKFKPDIVVHDIGGRELPGE